MKTSVVANNWMSGTSANVLENIHQKDINITIYNRDVTVLEKEIQHLLKRQLNFKSNGDIQTIMKEIVTIVEPNKFPQLFIDIEKLLGFFKETTGANSFQLLLATIKGNMCRKFHTDVNDLRMLCTYSGTGTLWLTEDNFDRKALNAYRDNDLIVIDKTKIEQTETGAVIILKGSMYSKEAKAVVHRSPTIEENKDKRLLLRIDTILKNF